MASSATDFLSYLRKAVDRLDGQMHLSTGKAFAMWYAVEQLGISEDDAYEAISFDGGNDKDIDLFYVDELADRVLIGQMKFQRNGKYKADKGDFLKVIHTTDWLKDPEALRREGRSDLADAAEQYLLAVARGLSVEYLYVYTGPAHKDVADTARQFNVSEAGRAPSRSARVVTLESLRLTHDEAIDQARRIDTATVVLKPKSYFEEVGSFGKAIVGSLSCDELRKLHDKYDDRLFDRNVRLFLGARKASVNAGIRQTLESPSDRKNFWAYNNGITFICDSYELDKNRITIKNFSIVNGCQTTVSVANALATAAREASVLVRFIAAPERLIDAVIRYTNSQSPIRAWDLEAQDKTQKRLQKELAGLTRPFFYALRRGERIPADDRERYRRDGKLQTIPFDRNAQYLAAFRGYPVMAYKEKARVFIELPDKIFPPDLAVPELILGWQAGCVASEVVQHELELAVEKDDKERIAVLKRGATYFVLAAMFVVLHERNGATFLNKLKVEVAESKKTRGRLKNYATVALEWYVEAMQDLATGSDDVLTLVRAEDTWMKLRPKIESKWKVYSLSRKAMEEALPKL